MGDNSWFGVNSTIKNNITIAERTVIGMSACITKDTIPGKLYIGIPGKIKCDSSKIASSL